MKYRELGATGLRVSEVGLGCSSLGETVFEDNSASSRPLLQHAFDHGVTFFDTSGSYGYGSSEMLIGEVFKGRRDQVVIATKGGQLATTLGRFGRLVRPVIGPFRPVIQALKGPLKQKSDHREDFSAAYLTRALEGSLSRLQTDYLDVYQLHSPTPGVLQSGEAFEALERWKDQGKIRFYGVSVKSVDDGLFCLDNTNVDTLQVPFNLLEREAGKVLLPQAKAAGVAIIARVPFGRGLLTDSGRVATGLRTGDSAPAVYAVAERRRLSFLIDNGRRTWIMAAIRFVLGHDAVSTVIPGTTSLAHLEENLAALEATPLSEDEMRRVQAVE